MNKRNTKYIIFNVLLGAAVWLNSLKGGFHYDDFHVLKKTRVLFDILNFRFVGWLTLFINSLPGESNTVFYHLTNLFIHVCAGICIYFIVLFIIKKDKSYVPFFVSALFMVHPLATEPVNYISARFTQLAALFCFSTLLFFILYTQRRKTVYLALTVISFLLGMYSKGVGIYYVTVAILVYSFCFLDWKGLFANKRNAVVIGGVMFLLFFLMLSFAAQRLKSPFFWQHFMVQNKVFLLKYFRLMALPVGLNVDHWIMPPKHFLFDFRILLSLALNVTVVAGAVLMKKRNKLLSFAVLWIYLMSFPYFLLTTKELVVEYRTYPALFGFVLMLGYFLGEFVNGRKRQRIIFSIVLLFFSIITVTRNRVWSDDLLLWRDAAEKSPQSARAYCNLGIGYKNKGFYDRAIEAFNRSLELKFQYPYAVYMNRGVVYAEKGFYARAIDDFNRALELYPNNCGLYLNRGRAYAMKGLFAESIADFTRTVELEPGNARAFFYRGRVYDEKGLYGKSMDDLNRAIELDPKLINAWFVRGNVHLEKGLSDKAVSDYETAIRLNPEFMNAYNNLGSAYAAKGLYDKAIRSYSIAIEKFPDYSAGYRNRAAVYRRLGEQELAFKDEIKLKELSGKPDK